jgi:hypothetical protein
MTSGWVVQALVARPVTYWTPDLILFVQPVPAVGLLIDTRYPTSLKRRSCTPFAGLAVG